MVCDTGTRVRGLLLVIFCTCAVHAGCSKKHTDPDGSEGTQDRSSETGLVRKDQGSMSDSRLAERIRSIENLDDIAGVAAEIEGRWERGDRQRYFDLMFELCSRLQASEYLNPEQSTPLREYVQSVLKRLVPDDNLIATFEYQTRLVSLSMADERFRQRMEPAEWPAYRRTNARIVLQAWQRLRNAIIPDFDFDDKPSRNICPPGVPELPSGISPKAIKDPGLRARYEEALADNARKAKLYGEQMHLRRIDDDFSWKAKRYLCEVYSQKPQNLEELEKLLGAHIAAADTRADILRETEKALDAE